MHAAEQMAGTPAARLRVLAAACAIAFGSACGSGSPATVPAAETPASPTDVSQRARNDALRAARVWTRPSVPIARANLADNPPGPARFAVDAEVTCRFAPIPVGGTSPKFNCELPGGDVIRVKYGAGNPEVHAEVAATRLFTALGFGADGMHVVKRVRCLGCPAFPYQALKCLDTSGLMTACFPGGIDYGKWVDFETAVIERRFPGTKIEAAKDQGWAWYELETIDPAHGGAARAEVDALRLVALLIVHWDNKAENQRLVCPSGAATRDGCATPWAIVQDLGATFGPFKVDLANWRRTPIWADARTCRVSMKSLPWGGGTFPDTTISEEGRRFALDLLGQLSDEQLADLFTASRITTFDQVSAAGRDAAPWVAAFKAKVDEIRRGGPCPAGTPPPSSSTR